MFGFPDKDKLTRLIGKELVQICLGRFQISILLSSGETIVITSSDSFYGDNAEALRSRIGNLPILGELLSENIVDVEVLSGSRAKLILDNGVELLLRDDSDVYETITFNFSDSKLIV